MSSNETSTPIKGQPSEKQLQLLGAIMQNCQGKLDINWDEVANQAGYKTSASARESYRVLAKKFGWNASTGSGGPGSGTTPTPKANNKNNNKGGVATGPSSGPTPTKVQKNTGKVGTKGGRGRPRKGSTIVCKDDMKDDEDEAQIKEQGEKAVKNQEDKEEVVKTEASGNPFLPDAYKDYDDCV